MENLGPWALLLAVCLAPYAVAASIVGVRRRKPFLLLSGQRAVYAVWLLLTVASAVLLYAFQIGDFRFAYVAANSDRAMSWSYKIAAWWGGQEGSLLFWSWLLAGYAAVAVYLNRRNQRDSMPYTLAILMAVLSFFLFLNNFVANPFRLLAVGREVIALPDGNGLNPLLQYPLMRIHPPILYLGYVGMTVPFAFAMGSLIARHSGEAWIMSTRRWSLITWLFQGTGIVLGAYWAYAALGWGGYWAWDPVENASLLPWISSTAFLHSAIMQEKKRMMKIWNATLVSISFLLCVFGTMMTRSGMVNSVHAFAKSSIGQYFVAFLAVAAVFAVWAIVTRLDILKSEAHLDRVLSRESGFLFNNFVLLAACFAVLWGTLFPVITERFLGEKITLDGVWFNRIMIPIGLVLLLLAGAAPLLPWGRASSRTLRRIFRWPIAVSIALAATLFMAGIHSFYPLTSFALCGFVAFTVGLEFLKGARAIQQQRRVGLPRAIFQLTGRNNRRYGGYLVHVGMLTIFVGLTGSAFNQSIKAELAVKHGIRLGRYDLTLLNIVDGDHGDYLWQRARVEVREGGSSIAVLEPERQYYKSSRQGIGRVDIRRRLREDLYLNFAGLTDSGVPVIEAYLFPLVDWIWIGATVLVFGTLLTLRKPRTPGPAAASPAEMVEFDYAPAATVSS
ncbi:MAG: cytochrome c-type biogenesis CcmF C-terminal domain-containing protein [Bryobacteraceae bacterium]